MYPLKDWRTLKRGYKFKEKTWYSRHHLGLDLICETGTSIHAPFDGYVEKHWGYQGGNTIYFHWDKKIMRVLHLSKFGKIGNVKGGQIIGYIGNTGILSRGSHAHIDISKNKVNIYDIDNFINPDTFNFSNMKLLIDNNNDQYLADEDSKFGVSIADEEMLCEITTHFAKLGVELKKPVLTDMTPYYIVHGSSTRKIKMFFNL